MARQKRFTLRISEDESAQLDSLARRMQRTRSDTLRLIIRQLAARLDTEQVTSPDAFFDQLAANLFGIVSISASANNKQEVERIKAERKAIQQEAKKINAN